MNVKSVSLMAFSLLFLSAQKTDYSGIWKLNFDETVFSQEFSKNSVPIQLFVKQNENTISIERLSRNGKGEMHSYTEMLPYDGKTVETIIGATKKTATLNWSSDGKILTETANYSDSTAPAEYLNIRSITKWVLSDDRKKLTINSVEELTRGNDSTKMVYDKQ